MEEGESPLETLDREIQEEVGMKIDVNAAKLFHVGWYKGFGDRAQENVYKTFWIVPVSNVSATLSWEHQQFFWFQIADLPDDFVGPYRAIVDRYQKSIS